LYDSLHKLKIIMSTKVIIHRLRIAGSAAMVGCVLAGIALGWMDLPIDPRAGGATIGAVWAIFKFHLLA
jgi:hypothetical protein